MTLKAFPIQLVQEESDDLIQMINPEQETDLKPEDVPEELLGDAVNEVVAEFGAVTFYKQAAEGHWRHDDTLYCDDLALLVVDIRDTPKNRKWMRAYRER